MRSLKVMVTFITMFILLIGANINVQAVEEEHQSESKEMIEAKLKELILRQMDSYNWNLKDLDFKIIKESVQQKEFEIDYHIFIKHTLNYVSPEDSPVIQGKIAYLKEITNDKKSQEVIRYAQEEIDEWTLRLQDYINNTQETEQYIKVKGELSEDKRLNIDSLSIYFDNVDGFVPFEEMIYKTDDQDVFTTSYNDLYNQVVEFEKSISLNSPVYDYYNGQAAVNYANKWVAATTLHCGDGVTLQNTSNYNPSYTAYTCNDCANFVSQALKAGGIPENSSWNPSKATWYNTGYSSSIYGLRDYMVDQNYAKVTTYSNSKPGDMIMMSSFSHVMLVVYNDGTTVKFSAHSSDRKNYNTNSSGKTFYRMQFLSPFQPE